MLVFFIDIDDKNYVDNHLLFYNYANNANNTGKKKY